MPRVHPSLLWRARAIDSLLPPLLPICRNIRSSQNELRWIRDNANRLVKSSARDRERLVYQHVLRRSRGEPLQYILGSEFFGDLEIKCRPGVLIPRQDTAASVSHLVKLLSRGDAEGQLPNHLRVLDLCSGSGCISLLFCHEFYSVTAKRHTMMDIVGVDLSPTAVRLARENKHVLTSRCNSKKEESFMLRCLRSINFLQADVLFNKSSRSTTTIPTLGQAIQQLPEGRRHQNWDMLICNPPYVSSKQYLCTTHSSVRHFEPKRALVPSKNHHISLQQSGDLFYPAILRNASNLNTKIVLLEVADMAQAKRVATMALQQRIWSGIEIWRDEPGRPSETRENVILDNKSIPILGSGNGRSVLLYRADGRDWLGKTKQRVVLEATPALAHHP